MKLNLRMKLLIFAIILALIPLGISGGTLIRITRDELKIIGELATKYDVIVMEDLAYFGMDFRRDMSKPGKAPFQPTVTKYTSNYVLFISSSKITDANVYKMP